jgi:hypothetical protein
MSDLFDFLTVANLFIFLLCIIGLYYSINLVINYYAPTTTPFVNMYFLYYIFFIITLLISVACNNYIEMTDSDITVDDITKTIPNADTIADGKQKIATVSTVAEPTVISTNGRALQKDN